MDTFKISTQPTHVPSEDFTICYEEVTFPATDPHKDKWINILSW